MLHRVALGAYLELAEKISKSTGNRGLSGTPLLIIDLWFCSYLPFWQNCNKRSPEFCKNVLLCVLCDVFEDPHWLRHIDKNEKWCVCWATAVQSRPNDGGPVLTWRGSPLARWTCWSRPTDSARTSSIRCNGRPQSRLETHCMSVHRSCKLQFIKRKKKNHFQLKLQKENMFVIRPLQMIKEWLGFNSYFLHLYL